MNRSVNLTAIAAAISLALLGTRPASAQLTLQAGSGPAFLPVNNFGPTTAQVIPSQQSAYGGGASSGFVFQPGQTTSAINIMVAYNANGSSGLYVDALAPVYDGNEDSTFAILNNSNSLITSITLNAPGSDIAGFDGDGADDTSVGGAGYTTIVPSVPPGMIPTGYEGPTSWFTVDPTNSDILTINFVTPIAVGGSAFFFVENYPQPIVDGFNSPGGGIAVSTTSAVPEPSGLLVMAGGMAGLVGYIRRRASRPRA